MDVVKQNFLKITYGNGDVLRRILVISFTFLLLQISLTSIFFFLEPKFYATFQGFLIKEKIFLFLGISIFIFLITLIISISYKLLTKK